MQRQTVDKMIHDYKKCAARRDFLREEVAVLEKQLQRERDRMLADDALHAMVYDGMPHSAEPGRPVENLVLRYASGYEPQYIKDMSGDVAALKAELSECTTVCKCVDAWLIALTEKERQIIQMHMIDGYSWSELLMKLQTASKEGCKLIKRRALQKIYEIAR